MKNGKALQKFKDFLQNQGGDSSVADNPEKLPQAAYKIDIPAKEAGVVSEIVADQIGVAAMLLGAGRATKEDKIDLAVGIMLRKKSATQSKKANHWLPYTQTAKMSMTSSQKSTTTFKSLKKPKRRSSCIR